MGAHERAHERGRGREREGDTESEVGSWLWAVSTEPDTGLKPTDHEIMTLAEVGCLTDWATQVPPAAPYCLKHKVLPCSGICLSADPYLTVLLSIWSQPPTWNSLLYPVFPYVCPFGYPLLCVITFPLSKPLRGTKRSRPLPFMRFLAY